MNALVLFRSYHGNTKQVADAIANRLQVKGHHVVVQDVRDRLPDLTDIDLLVNGAPTRFKGVNGRSTRILRKLKRRGIGNAVVAIFDTCAVLPTDPVEMEKARPWIVPGAAGIMHRAATQLGLNVYPETLRCEVKDLKGPLVDDAIGKAVAYAEALASAVKAR